MLHEVVAALVDCGSGLLLAGFAGYDASHAVLLFVDRPRGARHHGARSSPLAVACAGLGFLVISHLALYFFLSCCLAQMLGIIAGMDQTDSYVARLWPTWCSWSRLRQTAEIPQLQLLWSSTALSLRRVYPMVQTVRQTWDFPVASHGGRRPRCAGRAGSLPRRGHSSVAHHGGRCPCLRSRSSRVHTWRRQSSSHGCTRCDFRCVGQLIIALMS